MVSNSSKFSSFGLLALVMLLATPVEAQRAPALSANNLDSRTVSAQRKVDELYESGEFERAYFIYRNELVPIGDKYAQYMVGYMHLIGRGTDEDPVAASAWYRLAAERGTPEFVAVRDQSMRGMTADERRRSDDHYLRLRRQFSDLVILLEDIKHRHRDLRSTTGSRLASHGSAMTVINTNSSSRPQSGAVYYGRIESELERKLLILAELGDFPDLDTDPRRVDIRELERLVEQRIRSIPD